MKKYDRIWIPDEDGDYEVCDVEYITPEVGRLSPEENVIVITMEELRSIYDAAYIARGHQNGATVEDYFKYKGIQIP